VKLFICLILMGCVVTLTGSAPSVGIVKSVGDFRVDGSTIRGNSTVFEGSLIETTAARSTVGLGGSQITLLPNSSVRVYRDRTVLESGSELMRNGEAHTIEAATLQIASAGTDGVVLVAMGGPKNIKVFASSGSAQVRTATGVLLARLSPGMGLAFTPQAGAATAIQMMGVLEFTDSKYFLTDATSKTRVELRGLDLVKFKGKGVLVVGSVIFGATATGGASQVIQVTKIELTSESRKAAGLVGVSGSGAAPTAGGGNGWLIAGIGVVLVGGTLGGLAASGAGPFSTSTP
jgi:hypothetical protein